MFVTNPRQDIDDLLLILLQKYKGQTFCYFSMLNLTLKFLAVKANEYIMIMSFYYYFFLAEGSIQFHQERIK